ncbi:MAG: hypothetical protein WCC74_00230 [Minisyncoccia bacterium]
MKYTKMDWKTWKTVKLGKFKNVDEIRKALRDGAIYVDDRANDILGKPAFKMSETEQDVELVEVSNEELGFKDGACYADSCKRASEIGLDKCPAEVGPQLPLQCKDQPKKTFVVVAMEAITDSNGHLRVFCVESYGFGRQYLDAIAGNAGIVLDGRIRFLFLRRKNTQSTEVLQVS